MGEFRVRFVLAEDFPQWLKLWSGYNEFYGRVGDQALPKEVTEATWARFFDSSEPMRSVVAVTDEGRLLGFANYLFHRNTAAIGLVCYLQDLFTRDGERGRGVGRALIEAVYENAKVQGSNRVYWQTHESNVAAMKLYDKVAQKSGFLVYRKLL